MILEIAAFNYESALMAARAGADRLELCDNYAAGGITVSREVLEKVRAEISISVFPIIRPRGGDFYYSEAEFNVMKTSIMWCKELGYEGVVLGLLNEDKSIDTKRTSYLVEMASPLEVTFHRAFDACIHPMDSLEKIINCGCKRLLSSGQKPSAIEGKELLTTLVDLADNRIIIMPGGGIRLNTLQNLVTTGATEFHSASLPSLKENAATLLPDIPEIKRMKSLLAQYSFFK